MAGAGQSTIDYWVSKWVEKNREEVNKEESDSKC